MKNKYVLEITGLKKYFGQIRAVDGISIKVQRGQVYGFLGPNGSGKTTTIAMVLGLLYPSAGMVSLFGEPVHPQKTNPLRRVGALVGSPSLIPYLSARGNLALLTRLSPSLPRSRIEETLEMVGLTAASDRRVNQFSSGMKQRLGIAMSLVHKPELLVLDEPTNGMDPAGMYDVRNLLANLSDQGMTVFLSSHLLHEVEQICDRVAVIKQGKLVAEGDVTELIGKRKIVKVRVSSTRETVRLLEGLPGCRNIESNGAYVSVSGPSSEEVVAYLVANGVVPTEVKTGRMDLEQIYLKLTNGKSSEVDHVYESAMD